MTAPLDGSGAPRPSLSKVSAPRLSFWGRKLIPVIFTDGQVFSCGGGSGPFAMGPLDMKQNEWRGTGRAEEEKRGDGGRRCARAPIEEEDQAPLLAVLVVPFCITKKKKRKKRRDWGGVNPFFSSGLDSRVKRVDDSSSSNSIQRARME